MRLSPDLLSKQISIKICFNRKGDVPTNPLQKHEFLQ